MYRVHQENWEVEHSTFYIITQNLESLRGKGSVVRVLYRFLSPQYHRGAGAAGEWRFMRPSRFFLAGEIDTVGTVRQLEDDATGWGGGVGETPWNHVDVP